MWGTTSLLLCSVLQVLVNASDDLDSKVDMMDGTLDKVEADLKMTNAKLEEIEQKMEPLLQYLKQQQQQQQQGPTNTTLPSTTGSSFQINDLLQFGNLVVDFSETAGNLEGILVAGGLGAYHSAEVFIPANGKTCLFPDLPYEALQTTMDLVGDLPTLCGSNDSYKPYNPNKWCVQLTPPSRHGKWTLYANTTEVKRRTHSSWVSSSGLVLIGGLEYYASKSTEMVPAGGKSFDLQKFTRNACAINAEDSVILTGGLTSGGGRLRVASRVARYNLQGFVENLPDMMTKRYDHACGSYTSGGKLVLLVAGGDEDNIAKLPPLSSSEMLVTGSTAWTATKPLPRGLESVASVAMSNKVYLLGGQDEKGDKRVEILAFDGEEWKEVGKMKKARYMHAASKIVSTNGEPLCL